LRNDVQPECTRSEEQPYDGLVRAERLDRRQRSDEAPEAEPGHRSARGDRPVGGGPRQAAHGDTQCEQAAQKVGTGPDRHDHDDVCEPEDEGKEHERGIRRCRHGPEDVEGGEPLLTEENRLAVSVREEARSEQERDRGRDLDAPGIVRDDRDEHGDLNGDGCRRLDGRLAQQGSHDAPRLR
jgi:hypothetical protein